MAVGVSVEEKVVIYLTIKKVINYVTAQVTEVDYLAG